MKQKNKLIHWFIITTFVSLYLIVSVISTIHVIDFFSLSNPQWLSISLAIAFEIGAAASLASIIIMDKMNKSLVWGLFIILTAMQMMGNTYYSYGHLQNYQKWIELFGLIDEDPLYQKRILSIISGAILPLVALGFIKSLVDYIKPEENSSKEVKNAISENHIKEEQETRFSETFKKDFNDRQDSSKEKFLEESLTKDIEPIEDILNISENDYILENPLIATQEKAVNFVKNANALTEKEFVTDKPIIEEPAIEEESSRIDIINGEEEKKSLT